MIRALLLVVIASVASAQDIYDLLIKNGNLVDIANHRTGKYDIAVTGKNIARVAKDIPAVQARVVIEADGYYVTPGLIDVYAHLGPLAGSGTVQPDHNTLRYGVTTVVHAGTEDFESFSTAVIDHARVRVLSFADAGRDPLRAMRQHPKSLVGIRVTSADQFDAGLKAAEQAGTVLMVDAPDESLLKRLRPKDLQAQAFTTGMPELSLREAQKRGVRLSTGSVLFRIASQALQHGLYPDMIATGMDRASMLLPRTNMMTTMSKFLNLGLSIEQLVERTTTGAARAISHPELGTLSEGAVADIALLAIERGSFGFLDAAHTRLAGDRQIRCLLTVRNGAVVWDSDGLFAPDSERIGPYSNYK